MNLRTDLEELKTAWRALRSESAADGWRTIPVSAGSACPVLAGREFPRNEEALLVGFAGITRPRPESLPKGQGFAVTCPDLGKDGRNHVWIALARQTDGEFELFSMMAGDILQILEAPYASDDRSRYNAFIDRIRAWQDFMQRNVPRVLSPEAEVGLLGELQVLDSLLTSGVAASTVVASWLGPRRGLHDFSIGVGAIEVKSTITQGSFPAGISSLDQLNDAAVTPLYLAAIRFQGRPSGVSLPDQIRTVRTRLSSDSSVKADFDSRLIQAGYLDDLAEQYTRRFELEDMTLYAIRSEFPRLTPGNVPAPIRKAIYELDLDKVSQPRIELAAALIALGVPS